MTKKKKRNQEKESKSNEKEKRKGHIKKCESVTEKEEIYKYIRRVARRREPMKKSQNR